MTIDAPSEIADEEEHDRYTEVEPDDGSTDQEGGTDGGEAPEVNDEPYDDGSSDGGPEEVVPGLEGGIDEQHVEEIDIEGEDGSAGPDDVLLEETGGSELSDEELLDVLTLVLQEEGYDLEAVYMDGNDAVVEYRTSATTEEELLYEIGFFSGAYAGTVGEGFGADALVVVVLAADGTPLMSYYVTSAWAQAYVAGEISDEDFLLGVLEVITYY